MADPGPTRTGVADANSGGSRSASCSRISRFVANAGNLLFGHRLLQRRLDCAKRKEFALTQTRPRQLAGSCSGCGIEDVQDLLALGSPTRRRSNQQADGLRQKEAHGLAQFRIHSGDPEALLDQGDHGGLLLDSDTPDAGVSTCLQRGSGARKRVENDVPGSCGQLH